jgi:hypothetical protein
MSESKSEEKVMYHPSVPAPRRPEKPEEWKWPSPTPLPIVPAEDTGRILKQILDRLDAIEKRLESIEKALMQRQQSLL